MNTDDFRPPTIKEDQTMKSSMTPQAAARIQSATARTQGQVSSGGFAARAQAAASRNGPSVAPASVPASGKR